MPLSTQPPGSSTEDTSGPNSAEAARRLAQDYLDTLAAAHAAACKRVDRITTRTFLLAGLRLRLVIAGESLAAITLPALAHLPADDSGPPDGEFLLWDEAASGVPLPPRPWIDPGTLQGVKVTLPRGAEAFRYSPQSHDKDTFVFTNRVSGITAIWVRDARRLPFYQLASPLLLPLHWWASARGLRAVHAGCVATPAGAALIVGPSGAGKSTTSLLCATSGFDYLSDDYCLVRPGREAEAFCLFNNAKLHRDQFTRFPSLAPLAVQPPADCPDKPIVFFHQHHPGRVRLAAPLRALILPVITGLETTTATRIDPAATLRTIASSSLSQLPQDDAGLFFDLAGLARRLPCYQLNLGTRLDEIPRCIHALIGATS